MKNTTMKNANEKKALPSTRGKFMLHEVRRSLWSICYALAMILLLATDANVSDEHAWVSFVCVGVFVGLLLSFVIASNVKFSMIAEGRGHLDELRRVFGDMRSLGKQTEWMSEHAKGTLEWNFDEQRAEVRGTTDDGELHALFYVEIVSDDSSYDNEILGTRSTDKCPVIVYQVPVLKKQRDDRTKWVRVGSGATMMQGTNEANSHLNDAMRDVYNLQDQSDAATGA
jgi:hypothetical protein